MRIAGWCARPCCGVEVVCVSLAAMDRLPSNEADVACWQLHVRGLVQGVGFRPFVWQLARRLNLVGWVCNNAQGVLICVQGSRPVLETFMSALRSDAPPTARVESIENQPLPPTALKEFVIQASPADATAPTAAITPDLAICAACRQEWHDPDNRGYQYPFINCTQCGPRYSILERIPYDRPNTSMRHFHQCPACQKEYDDPANRRYHAQPNACPQCGPQCAWWDDRGMAQATGRNAVNQAVKALQAGHIVAVKGIGGFHLMTLADRPASVETLRERKQRDAKPFAVMFPALDSIRAYARVSALEATLLESPVAPIVLVERHREWTAAIAPDNPFIGALLPYSPLHLALMTGVGAPLIATSANLSDEPLCYEEQEALERLQGIADGFLVHNRPIVRPIDDSVVRVVLGRPLWLRRARGLAPAPLTVSGPAVAGPVVAVGGHLKNTVAIACGNQVIMSPHVGDLDTAKAEAAHHAALDTLTHLYPQAPASWVCDPHPDYVATRRVRERIAATRIVEVQHHFAHALSTMADNGIEGPVLGVIGDGTGYGPDGTVWGGEFLHVTDAAYERVGYLRPFPLPGGDEAVKSPARSALGLLYTLKGEALFDDPDGQPFLPFTPVAQSTLRGMLSRSLNCPLTSSMGRLFDAVSSLLGFCQQTRFEGQAAMALEFAAERAQHRHKTVSAPDGPDGVTLPVVDWSAWIERLLSGKAAGASADVLAYRFHHDLAHAIVRVAAEVGEQQVVLGGGCFQNRCLLELTVQGLQAAGHAVYWPKQVPPNDGGLALGQAYAGLLQQRMHTPR